MTEYVLLGMPLSKACYARVSVSGDLHSRDLDLLLRMLTTLRDNLHEDESKEAAVQS
jgi:hypothetical protein